MGLKPDHVGQECWEAESDSELLEDLCLNDPEVGADSTENLTRHLDLLGALTDINGEVAGAVAFISKS